MYWPQYELFEFCKKNNITFTAYGPIGAPGRKAFKVTTNWPEGEPMKDPLVLELAKKYKKTPAQVPNNIFWHVGKISKYIANILFIVDFSWYKILLIYSFHLGTITFSKPMLIYLVFMMTDHLLYTFMIVFTMTLIWILVSVNSNWQLMHVVYLQITYRYYCVTWLSAASQQFRKALIPIEFVKISTFSILS